MEGVTISTILSDIGSIFSSAMEWCGDVAQMVTTTPIMMLFCGVTLVGLGVGLFKRILN